MSSEFLSDAFAFSVLSPLVVKVTGKGTITYTYDAAGNKLKKVTTEGSAVTTTLYLAGAVYKNDTLQFLAQEEGRIRFKPQAGAIAASLQYDYMLKDHLGNVRMVLTEELQQDKYPVASLETSKVNTEDDYYTIDQAKIVDASTVTGLPTYTNDNGIGNNPADATFEAANSQKLYKLNSSSNKTGLGMTLKVMAGDKLDIFGKSYYFQNNTSGSSANSAVPVLDILSGMVGSANGAVPAAGHSDVTGSTLNGLSTTTTGISGLLSDQTTESANSPQVPKAYINYLFFDEQFKYVSGGFSKVGTNSTIKNHYSELQNLTASKSGYIYIYVSNESPVNVFFDNLQVVHTRSPILEETHYYPFGLVMAGISSKGANTLSNKFKYSGKELQSAEFSDGSGLEQYDFGARNYDPQIGRWTTPDPMADKWNSYSPYNYAVNNPINVVDPDGQDAIFTYDAETKTLTISAKIFYQGKHLPKDAKEREKLMKTVNDNLKAMYKDGTGKDGDNEWTVKFDITASINEDVKQDDLQKGENIMTVDGDAKGLIQADGTKRSNVQGGKSNMGYLQNKAGTWVDTHEIGHMLGFKDRYDDYSKADKTLGSVPHDGYQDDAMGAFGAKALNQSHYDDAVKYTNFKLTVAQANLLPALRTNSVNVTRNFDGFRSSSVAEKDVPVGWIKR